MVPKLNKDVEDSLSYLTHDDWNASAIELAPIEESKQQINRHDEIELVHRLDKRLLLFAMFGNLVKTLDNSNLASAFISGMEEELNVTGLQYNWMGTLFMVGYLSMQLPSNILLSRIRPSRYLPALEAIWCVLTLLMACVQSVEGVYLIRFILGLAEAGFYPGIVFLLGTWYTKRELGKRLALLSICGAFGSGLSGVVQAVVLKTMDGMFGVSGWRWMFVIDASVTVVLACLGYTYLPDYPHNTEWLNEKERDLATQRTNNQEGQDRNVSYSFKEKIRLLAKNKYLYPFVMSWAMIHTANGAPQVLGIVAKKLGFDAVTANLLTTPDTIITMLAGLCIGFLSDKLRNRYGCIVVPAAVGLIGMWLPFPVLYIAFLITHAGLGSTSSIIMTWASETISVNTEIRAMAIAIMNTSSSFMWTWTSLILWPVTDAPYYHKGFTVSVFLIILFIAMMSLIVWFQRSDGRVKRANSDDFTVQQMDTTAVPLLQAQEEENFNKI
ncbi:Pantothenate transporter liz1 [Choanephora cucurbitarum]|uniref:Pantothenate transporter liz1 n=1 Tax=Choanephora cucurbitarum TaxID=101091 RepID=A0A1C7NRT1_9FUNG|nr:Pantothenate transporter liz1 [Choanephora cucurbitarum]